MKILIVEDDLEAADAMVRGLAEAGHDCVQAADGEQGLTAVTPQGTFALTTPFTAWRDPDDPYQLMVESFADSVIGGKQVAIPLEESVANMRLIDRIREAARI